MTDIKIGYGKSKYTEDLYEIFESKLKGLNLSEFGGTISTRDAYVMIDDIAADMEVMLSNHNALKDKISRELDVAEKKAFIEVEKGNNDYRKSQARVVSHTKERMDTMNLVVARIQYLWSVKNRLDIKREAVRIIGRK